MKDFNFNTVPQLISSPDCALELAKYCTQLGIRKLMMVTDPGLVASGLVKPILQSLDHSGLGVSLFDQVQPDPSEEVVINASVKAQAEGVDGVVALGGGSSMDVAKVVAILLSGNQSLAELYGVDNIVGDRLPLIMIPTTAGTGSEVTPVAVITTGATTKAGISSTKLLPDVALLDARLTLGLPPLITAMTGVDAIVHAIEAFTSKLKKNPVSDMYAREALRLLVGNIRAAHQAGHDLEARNNMLLGATLAGQAFANAPVAAVHALAYPLGGHYHIPHGLSNSLMLPSVLEFNSPVASAMYAELAPIVTGKDLTGSDEAKTAAMIEGLQTLIDDLGLCSTLRNAGIARKDLPILAKDALKQERLLVNNPRQVKLEDALAMYQAAY